MYRNDLIIDVGAHMGDDTKFYMDKGFAVVAVEANPVLVEQLQQRFSDEIARGILTIEPCAIGATEGVTDFFVHKTESLFSALEVNLAMHEEGSFEKIAVPCLPASTLFRRHGTPHYLKIDIEGGELPVIKALEHFDKPSFVSFEMSKDYIECLEVLVEFGYRGFKLVDQALNPGQACPFPPREGRFVTSGFTLHMSGPFGQESPGNWADIQELRKALEDATWEQGHWYDIHACLPEGCRASRCSAAA